MHTIIIDYGSGNLRSCARAFERAKAEGGIPGNIEVTASPAALADASHIVLPGVGAFGDCMQGISVVDGLLDALIHEVREKKKWFLGICVGMQLMLERGFEHGEHDGLGWIEGEVRLLMQPDVRGQMMDDRKDIPLSSIIHHPSSGAPRLKIPHMGWNELTIHTPSPLLEGINNGDHAYFVHSYHAVCNNPSDVPATTDYGGNVTAVIGRDNMFGTQFHPEKSQTTGLRLIRNFLAL